MNSRLILSMLARESLRILVCDHLKGKRCACVNDLFGFQEGMIQPCWTWWHKDEDLEQTIDQFADLLLRPAMAQFAKAINELGDDLVFYQLPVLTEESKRIWDARSGTSMRVTRAFDVSWGLAMRLDCAVISADTYAEQQLFVPNPQHIRV